jgi:hypothetical protein
MSEAASKNELILNLYDKFKKDYKTVTDEKNDLAVSPQCFE